MKKELIYLDKKAFLEEVKEIGELNEVDVRVLLEKHQISVAHQHKFTTITKVENNPAIRRCDCGYKEEVEPIKTSEESCDHRNYSEQEFHAQETKPEPKEKTGVYSDRQHGTWLWDSAEKECLHSCVCCESSCEHCSQELIKEPEEKRKYTVREVLDSLYWETVDEEDDYDGYLHLTSVLGGEGLKLELKDLTKPEEIGKQEKDNPSTDMSSKSQEEWEVPEKLEPKKGDVTGLLDYLKGG